MKLNLIIIFLIFETFNHIFTQQQQTNNQPLSDASSNNEGSAAENNKQNQAFFALIDKIYDYAAELQKVKEDPEIRRMRMGKLPNFYPKKQINLAKQMVSEKKQNGHLLKYFVEPYRQCIFPNSDVNSMTYCQNTFKNNRVQDCKHMMCINCCNHLLLMMKQTTKTSIVSEVLGLNDDAGFNKLENYITQNTIQKCRETCMKEYPIKEPIILPPPPKDPQLGKTKTNPAKSCIDILLNSVNAQSGTYYVQVGEKAPFLVYCDMDTDEGGWTLFYSYTHHPGQDLKLDSSQLPQSPLYGSSHMNLADLGFDNFDVSELKFFCMTKGAGETKYISFKSTNPQLLKTAQYGVQTHLKVESFTRQSRDAEPPQSEKQKPLERSQLPQSTTHVGQNSKGGFWDTPFGSSTENWTIRGRMGAGGKWECGEKLDSETGASRETVHTVWFRGQPPSKEFLEARALQRKKIQANSSNQ